MPGETISVLTDLIDARLPQTQCARCGYPRCLAYAEAVACGEADINQCPPGGAETIAALADLLGVEHKPLNPVFGVYRPRTLAVIKEAECIGCTLCLQACPVDAIIGAAKQMHTVIAEECIGCELCVAPCPVDCIELVPFVCHAARDDWPWPEYSREHVERARRRTQARIERLQRLAQSADAHVAVTPYPNREEMREEIAAAVTRVRASKMRRRVTSRQP
jgi:electron transport complex protein RnfB